MTCISTLARQSCFSLRSSGNHLTGGILPGLLFPGVPLTHYTGQALVPVLTEEETESQKSEGASR